MKKKFILIILAVLWLSPHAGQAQRDTLRIVTYNVLKFPGNAGAERIKYFRTVFRALQPDILVVQELETATGLQRLLNETMNIDGKDYYDAAPFLNGPDTDSGLIFNRDKVDLLAATSIRTTLRDIVEYRLRTGKVYFNIYSLHLKAGQQIENQNQRAREASVLRQYLNDLPPGSAAIVLGDFNLYGTYESAFNILTGEQADNDGRLFDPISAVGTWHNNQLFARIHTQSTRTTVLYDEGSPGGLDDRFDMILVTAALLEPRAIWILKDSYAAFGNDGRHFNKSINEGKNYAVPDSIADALYYASDHLPVVADFVVDQATGIAGTREPVARDYHLIKSYPNPFHGSTTVQVTLNRSAPVRLYLYDLLGREVRRIYEGELAAGEHAVSLDAAGLPAGLYFIKGWLGNRPVQLKMLHIPW